MVRSRVVIALALAAGVAAMGGAVIAHEGATGVVKQRMVAMENLGDAMKRVGAMIKGTVEFDTGAVKRAARTIGDHGGADLTRLFPEGSLQDPTRARPEIWREWQRFQALADELVVFSEALAAAADNGLADPTASHGAGMGPGMMGGDRPEGHPMDDPDALKDMPAQASFFRLAETCTTCHKAFRKKKTN